MEHRFDVKNKNNLSHRAWEAIKEFFGKEEGERPLNPDRILPERGTDASTRLSSLKDTEEFNAERLHRRTEQRALRDAPSTLWPG